MHYVPRSPIFGGTRPPCPPRDLRLWRLYHRRSHTILSHSKQFRHSKQFLDNIHQMMLASSSFTDETIFTVATLKNLQNGRLYAHPSTKKKDVTTECLHTQLMFSHWWHYSANHKWLTLQHFDTCQSRSQCPWTVSIVTWCCYNSFCYQK